MSSVASAGNPGMTYLTQVLSGCSSPLLSGGMSSSQVQSVIQNSSPNDLVQLSDQALQLQNIGTLFGNQETSQTAGQSAATGSNEILQSILNTMSVAANPLPSSASGTSLAGQITAYQSQMQAEDTDALLGISATTGVSGTSLNSYL